MLIEIQKQHAFKLEISLIDREIKQLKNKIAELNDLIFEKKLAKKFLAKKYYEKRNKTNLGIDVRKYPHLFQLSNV